MSSTTRWVGGASAALALTAALVAYAPTGGDAEATVHGAWKIEASGARIIGGYGNNFAYNGENVRSINGSAVMTLNSETRKAHLEINLKTTAASGPIRFAADKTWSGEIKIVQMIDLDKMGKGRIEENIFLHGDTGNEAPVMPKLFNYFATWGPSKIFVNGKEVIPMIGSHTMFSEQARGASGKIANAAGDVYSPMAKVKTGFTNLRETEFHYVAHTNEPDKNNFPPHTGWVHLHFSKVKVLEKPSSVEIPYTE